MTDEVCQTASGSYNSVGGDISLYKDQCGIIAGQNNHLTSWTISGPYLTYITLVVLRMQMSSYYCGENYVQVIESGNILLDKTCSTNGVTSDFIPRYMASSLSHSLSVNYLGTSSTGRGFEAVYYARGQHTVLTDDFGYIASPGYPQSYPNNANYTWLIASNSGNKINLSISVTSEGSYDQVKVYDGQYLSSLLLYSLYGTSSQNIRSTSNFMLIQFTSDGSNNDYKGFSAMYSTKSYFYEVSYGHSCTSSNTCIDGNGLTCNRGVCGCTQKQYYYESTRSCTPRQSHGSYCSSEEICDQELVCENSRCSCPKHQYYDRSSDYCISGRLKGDSCSSDNKCSDDLECVLYTCQEARNEEDDERPKVAIAMLVVAVIGWALVLTVSIALCVMCVKYRKQRLSQTNNINGEILHQAPLSNNSQGYIQTPNEQSFQIPNQQYLPPSNQFMAPNFQAVGANQYIPLQHVFSNQPDLQQQATQQPNLQQQVAHQHDLQQQVTQQHDLQAPNHPDLSNTTQAQDNEGFKPDSPNIPEDDDIYLNFKGSMN
ncbi:deleted in malignant brain tumors 1 protein-like isoform X1 [Biomphalaria pfeifferi]|uniref:Deleted in malignant brain tumors 1 protein-like isoform X1 n=1 Tax=Biomphalaria pfeifferi TaxID=112525 RepID=A0AAD8BF49_BIOPF|nr:deleted in malignant brain tumors 1 protein-like isoform X1 [Biomphalaria pfeifferi]